MPASRVPTRLPKDNSIDPEGEFSLGVREYFFYLLYNTARQRELFIERALEPTDLNHNHWRSLAIIRRLGSCSMKTLARFSTVDRTTLTRSVDQLVARGYVTRHTPEGDRRRVDLSITDEGEATYMQAVEIIKSSNRAGLLEVDEEGLRDVARTLQRVLNVIVDDEELAADIINFGRPPVSSANEA